MITVYSILIGHPIKTFDYYYYYYEKLAMGRGLYLFVDLSFGIALNLMLNRHHLLPPLREESNRKVVTFVPRPPEKQFSWTDGATVPK